VDVDFALRYEASDQSIRAHGIRVNTVQVEGLGRDGARLIDGYLRQLSDQALAEVVVHKLRPEDLALPSTMGLEPGSITVTPQGLVIGFVPQK
jgi:CRISPR/Cas system-associated protein Csm6